MMRRLVILLAILGLFAVGSRAQAQEIQLTGPLAGAPATRHLREYRAGRFEIAPTMSFTLLDEYERTILFGARATYNITDWLGIGVWGAGGVSLATDLTNKINQNSPAGLLTAYNIPNCGMQGPNVSKADQRGGSGVVGGSSACPSFASQTGKLNYIITPQIQIVPFRGKLSIFQKIFVDTDAYIHGGAAIVGLTERKNCGPGTSGDSTCSDPASSFKTGGSIAFTGTFGLGLNFYFLNLMSLGIEYRALPFKWDRSGFDSYGSGPNGKFPDPRGVINSSDQTLKLEQMITISLGFSFPTKPKVND